MIEEMGKLGYNKDSSEAGEYDVLFGYENTDDELFVQDVSVRQAM